MFAKGNMITGLLNQAKQVQEKMEALNLELEQIRVEGEAGGGLVRALANGQQNLLSVSIDRSLLGDDVELLEDLVTAAVQQALQKARDESQARMKSISGGMLGDFNLPEL